jgi:hypothetical protein
VASDFVFMASMLERCVGASSRPPGWPLLIANSQASILKRHLQSHEADVLAGLDDLSRGPSSAGANADFLVVPHTFSESDIPSTPGGDRRPRVVTEMWIERCLYQKAYLSPRSRVTHGLFKFPISGEPPSAEARRVGRLTELFRF